MSRSVRMDYEALRERQARAQEPAAPCEAERRIKLALYQLELDWGAGKFDAGQLKNILTGRDTHKCAGNGTEQCPGNLVTSSKLGT